MMSVYIQLKQTPGNVCSVYAIQNTVGYIHFVAGIAILSLQLTNVSDMCYHYIVCVLIFNVVASCKAVARLLSGSVLLEVKVDLFVWDYIRVCETPSIQSILNLGGLGASLPEYVLKIDITYGIWRHFSQ